MKWSYPVIFTETKDVILSEIPDFNIYSEGKNKENAIDMARDAIRNAIFSKESHNEFIPEPSKIDEITIENGTFYNEGSTIVLMVDVDM